MPAKQRIPVEFTGSTGEYFRIWIVNLALTIATAGIYSAWAKVRKRRYFYAHTRIDGEGFEYRASPLAILKGRLIALAALALFYASGHIAPALQVAALVAGAFVMPWLMVRSLAFNAVNTVHRGIRLRFVGTYRECLKIVLAYGLLALTVILYPYFKRKLVHFAAEKHCYGATQFTVADFKKPFIRAYAEALGLGILLPILFLFLAMAVGAESFGVTKEMVGAANAASVLATYAAFFLLFAYVRARTLNAVWNAISIGPVRFESTLRARDMIWLYASNIVALVLTLGLATPWAVVRTLRYRASKTAVLTQVSLDSFAQAEAEQVGATGEELGEMFSVDISL